MFSKSSTTEYQIDSVAGFTYVYDTSLKLDGIVIVALKRNLHICFFWVSKQNVVKATNGQTIKIFNGSLVEASSICD